MFVQIEKELEKEEKEDEFNIYKFEQQYVKYMQILDTDYKDFLVVYTCQENAEYIDERTGMDVMPEQVFQAYINQKNSNL